MSAPVAAAASARAVSARRALRQLWSILSVALLVAAWATLVRPEALGGPTGYVMVSGTSMEPLLVTGDLVITRKRETYASGDVVAFRIPQGDVGAGATVIHRIIGGSPSTGYVTLGDNRSTPDLWRPREGDVVGRMVFHVPGAGRWMNMAREPVVMGALVGLLVLIFWSPPPVGASRRRRPSR